MQVQMREYEGISRGTSRKKRGMGGKLGVRGDFNDIRAAAEKNGRRQMSEASLRKFNEFVNKMEMEEISFVGRRWTWANNYEGEGYIEE